MAGQRKLPDVPVLVNMVDRGMTHQEIADEFGVTRQAVTIKLRGARDTKNWRRDWPWEIESRHKDGWLYDGLAYYLAVKRKERTLLKREQIILDKFLEQLKVVERQVGAELVVDYDPETPVGFFVREREDGDPEGCVLAKTA